MIRAFLFLANRCIAATGALMLLQGADYPCSDHEEAQRTSQPEHPARGVVPRHPEQHQDGSESDGRDEHEGLSEHENRETIEPMVHQATDLNSRAGETTRILSFSPRPDLSIPDDDMADAEWIGRLRNGAASFNESRRANPQTRPDLSGCDLTGMDLRGCDLTHCDLAGAFLTVAELDGCDLSGSDLSGANLTGADATGAIFRKARLRGADLSFAVLNQADLRDADLSGARLTEAILHDADLRNARLEGAVMRRAILVSANLAGADMTGTDLEGAELEGAMLPIGLGRSLRNP